MDKFLFKANLNIARLFIAVTTISVIAGITLITLSFILTFNREVIITTKTATTTTKSNNKTQFAIGQYCQYNNQCPDKSYCSTTCKCPKNFYFNETSGSCLLRKTTGDSCVRNYECNIVVGLSCISGTCQCNPMFQYWNSTYYSGLGMQLGKCQNKKSYGMSCASSNEGQTFTYCSRTYGAVVSRIICGESWGYYHSFTQGVCTYPYLRPLQTCTHPNQVNYGPYELCLKDSDGVRRVYLTPRYNWWNGIYTRLDYGSSCNPYNYICNEYKNLVCSNLACACYDKYYYYNSTMCIYGKRYGETCTASNQCTPTSASMTCNLPFSGASYSVCRCNSTQFFDAGTEKCVSLKTFNESCRDSDECFGKSSNTMYCGISPGGSVKKCLCFDGYHGINSTCVAKVEYNLACNNTYECYDNLYQNCSSNKCTCAQGLYYDSNDYGCKYKLYIGDSCTGNSQCLSGTCSSLKCA